MTTIKISINLKVSLTFEDHEASDEEIHFPIKMKNVNEDHEASDEEIHFPIKMKKSIQRNNKFKSKIIKPNNPNKGKKEFIISRQQIKAANEIVEAFKQRRWTILTAQMQSGKTTTYYLTAAIMLMLRLVNKVIIFSGNNEIELKAQIKESKKSFIRHLRKNMDIINNYDLECENVNDLFEEMEDNLLILWGGHDMEKYEGHSSDDKVLYIWDESHYAQNTGMAPENFLTSLGIYASGNQYNLEENDSYMLSVSATPFSEISDNKHHNQNKSIVNLEVDEEYHGVKTMVERRLIQNYDCTQWKKHLFDTLIHHKSQTPKYALLRLRDGPQMNSEAAIQIIKRAGWKYKIFNSSKDNQLKTIQELENEPDNHTVIVMKAKCRMGKVVPKEFIAFCMETSRNPKTDVVLQGLLGRMCGYHSYNDIEIHLSDDIVRRFDGSTEFERYIQYIETNEIIPQKANNIIFGKNMTKSSLHPIIPIRIRFNEDHQDIRSEVQALFNEIYVNSRVRVYDDIDIIQNYNNREQTNELIQRLALMDTRKIIVRRVNATKKSYVSVPRIINESIRTRTPESLGSSCGIEANNAETVIIWVFEEDYEQFNINRGDIFIDARTTLNSFERMREMTETRMIPHTTGKETFCR